jgi:cell division protein FtsZ
MTINLSMPMTHELKPKITVVGVGGAGGNAVSNMITARLEGVDFVTCNTDAQALDRTLTDRKIQLGSTITHGLGAGARPEIGRAAAEEALDEIMDHLQGSHMVFITAGMCGGTGTGAAPVIARAVKERGILTVGVVTKPFHFEGAHRMRLAEHGLSELAGFVDTLIVIPNQNLFRIATERTTMVEAFRMADEVLHMGVRGVTDLMVMPGLINLDFADIRAVMSEMGTAMMGTGEAEGDRRALDAAEAAISNPLLDEVSMKGARGVLINITAGQDITLFEVDTAANRIREEVDPDANIIFGSTFDESMNGRLRVSVVATGINRPESLMRSAPQPAAAAPPPAEPTRPFVFQPGVAKPGAPFRGPQRPGRTPAAAPVDPILSAPHVRAISERSDARGESGAAPAREAPAAASGPSEMAAPAGAATSPTRGGAAQGGFGSSLLGRMRGALGGKATGETEEVGAARSGAPRWQQPAAPQAAQLDEVGEIPSFLRRDRSKR